MKMTKVIVNGIVIKDTDGSPDPSKLISWETEKDDEAISEAELILPRSVEDLVDLKTGQVVEIHAGWTTSTDKRYFYGYVDDIKPDGAIYRVLCRNEMIKLVKKNVNHVYDSSIDTSAGEVSEIVEDLIETYGGMNGTVQSSGTEDGKKIDQFKCVNTDIFERVIALKKALNWDLYYNDDTRVVFFQPKGYVDSKKILTVGSEIVGMPEWEIDYSTMINDLRIDGAVIQTNITESGQIGTTTGYTTSSILLTKTPDIVELYMDANSTPTTQKTGGSKDASTGHFFYFDAENLYVLPATGTTFTTDHYAIVNYIWSAPAPIHMVNQESIDDYGISQKAIELPDIGSVADAESRGQSILDVRSAPQITGKILLKSLAANIPNRGELMQVVDIRSPKHNGDYMSGEYFVSGIKYKFPSAVEEVILGDPTYLMENWQQNVEERLKRIEDQFVGNQDLLMELRDFKVSKDSQPRYRWIFIETVGGTNLFILNHATYGVLGTGRLGDTDLGAETDHYIQQYNDSYTEDFVDTDFEDTNGTASWSTTGSADFTSGQIALSKSIDYNNGTITVATLDSTEVSGDFKYELTADGSNWEEVTPGTAHTFTSTGTDLRFRITEDSATTGEISQVKIGDYH